MKITETEQALIAALRKFGITDEHLQHPLKSDALGMHRVAAAILREQPFFSIRVYNILKTYSLITDATQHYIDPDTRFLQVHSAHDLRRDSRLRLGEKSIDEITGYLESRHHALRLRAENEVVHERVCHVYRSVIDSTTDDAPIEVLWLADVINVDQLIALRQMGFRKLENFKVTTRKRMTSSSHSGLGMCRTDTAQLEEELAHYGIYLAQ